MSDRSVSRQPVQGLGELDQRFRGPLFAFFLKRVRDRSEAEDLTQEAFIRLALHPDRQGGANIDAYVFTIAGNLLRDRARAQFVRSQVVQSQVSALGFAEDAEWGRGEERTPERVLMAREMLKEVVGALKELSARTRDIFILSRLENVPQREIASLYGISVSAVEKHVIKAIAHLAARNLQP